MPGDLPRDLRAPLSVHATCAAHKTCALGGLYPEGVRDTGNAPAAVWSHELEGKGTTVTFVRASAVDVYGVVITGAGELKGLEPGAQTIALRPWMAFRAAGGGISLSASEPLTRVVLAAVTGGEPIRQAADALSSKKAAAGWQKRSEPITAIDLAAQPDLSWAGGAMHARIGFEGEKVRASFGVLMASKDAAVAQHNHSTSWEILVMLQGQGTLKVGADPASADLSPVALSDGAVTAVPKGTPHAWLPGDSRSLVAIQLYVPAGPEQRFKALASAAPAAKNP